MNKTKITKKKVEKVKKFHELGLRPSEIARALSLKDAVVRYILYPVRYKDYWHKYRAGNSEKIRIYRNKWQLNHYHKKIKPLRQQKRIEEKEAIRQKVLKRARELGLI